MRSELSHYAEDESTLFVDVARRKVSWGGQEYAFPRRNNRWLTTLMLAVYAESAGHSVPVTIEQLQRSPGLRARTLGRQIANWLRRDERIKDLLRADHRTKGPYYLKLHKVRIFDPNAALSELGMPQLIFKKLTTSPRTVRRFFGAAEWFQKGRLLPAWEACSMAVGGNAPWDLRLESRLLLSRVLTELGYFKLALSELKKCPKAAAHFPGSSNRIAIAKARFYYLTEKFEEARHCLKEMDVKQLEPRILADWYELQGLLEGRRSYTLFSQADEASDRVNRRSYYHQFVRYFRGAEENLTRALQLRLLHGDPHGLQGTCFNLGNLIWRYTDPDPGLQDNRPRIQEGLDWILLSEWLCERWKVGLDSVLPKFVLATINRVLGNYKRAWGQAKQGLVLAHDRLNVFDLVIGHRQHAKFYVAVALGKMPVSERDVNEPTEHFLQKGLAHLWTCYSLCGRLGLWGSEASLLKDKELKPYWEDAKMRYGPGLNSPCQDCALYFPRNAASG